MPGGRGAQDVLETKHALVFCAKRANFWLKVSSATVLLYRPWEVARSCSRACSSCTPAYGRAGVWGGSSQGADSNSASRLALRSGRLGSACCSSEGRRVQVILPYLFHTGLIGSRTPKNTAVLPASAPRMRGWAAPWVCPLGALCRPALRSRRWTAVQRCARSLATSGPADLQHFGSPQAMVHVLTLDGKLGRQRLRARARSAGPVAAAAAAKLALGRGSSLPAHGWPAIDAAHLPERAEDDDKQQQAGSHGCPGQAATIEPVRVLLVLLRLHAAQLATLGGAKRPKNRCWSLLDGPRASAQRSPDQTLCAG